MSIRTPLNRHRHLPAFQAEIFLSARREGCSPGETEQPSLSSFDLMCCCNGRTIGEVSPGGTEQCISFLDGRLSQR